jgi:toxin CptA
MPESQSSVFRVALKGSKRLAVLICAAHLAGIELLWPLAISLWLKLGLSLALWLSLLFSIRRDALLLARDSIVALELNQDGSGTLKTRGGEWQECALLGSSFISPYLTILNLEFGNRLQARHAVLLPDSLGAEDYRRLRVWLRWKSAGRKPNAF